MPLPQLGTARSGCSDTGHSRDDNVVSDPLSHSRQLDHPLVMTRCVAYWALGRVLEGSARVNPDLLSHKHLIKKVLPLFQKGMEDGPWKSDTKVRGLSLGSSQTENITVWGERKTFLVFSPYPAARSNHRSDTP